MSPKQIPAVWLEALLCLSEYFLPSSKPSAQVLTTGCWLNRILIFFSISPRNSKVKHKTTQGSVQSEFLHFLSIILILHFKSRYSLGPPNSSPWTQALSSQFIFQTIKSIFVNHHFEPTEIYWVPTVCQALGIQKWIIFLYICIYTLI